LSRASWLAVMVCSFVVLGALPAGPRSAMFAPAALGQNMGDRTVSGTVLSESSQAVIGATVFLKNLKTKSIRSYTSTSDGHYHFAQIDMSVDYDLWAEKDGKKSAVKTVSSWDARKEFISDLKLK
jgi:hypothetical protein